MKIYIRNTQDIFGFANRKSDVAAMIEENTREVIEHLIKLWLFPDAEDCNHWKQEVYNFLYRVPRLKGSNKFPSKKFILKNTIDVNRRSITSLLRIVLTDYGDSYAQVRQRYATMQTHIEYYFEWLAEELSKHGEVARNDVYSELSKLGFGK
jgi:hypothetical protein